MEKFTPDGLFTPEVTLRQPETGYRFSIDAILLAHHVSLAEHLKILDIGCGSGVIPVLLASRCPQINIIGIEIQEELARFAQKNAVLNKLSSSIQILHKDIREVLPDDISGPADIVLSNPPYKKKHTGRLNPDPQKAIARHEITLDLDLLLSCAKRLLHEKGKLYLIFPADRFQELIDKMASNRFYPETIRFIHTRIHDPARRVIVCALSGRTFQKNVLPPLYLKNG